MKTTLRYLTRALVTLGTVALVHAQELPVDRLSIPFSNPSQPGRLEAGLINGGITVTGYDGKEVIVEARLRTEKISKEKGKSEDRKTEGMHRIRASSTGLTVEEADNVMEVGAASHRRTVDLTIQVPRKTSLELSCINHGDIKVEGVDGEIEVNDTNGAVTLSQVSGAVVAHALNGDVVVTLVRVDPEKSMSFSSLNGDLDVTFPANIKADLKLKSDNGDIYSDFDIRMQQPTPKIEEESSEEGGRRRLKVEMALYGTINGGGPEIQFSTFNGNIYIRKGK